MSNVNTILTGAQVRRHSEDGRSAGQPHERQVPDARHGLAADNDVQQWRGQADRGGVGRAQGDHSPYARLQLPEAGLDECASHEGKIKWSV